ncbi:MAG: hypothetical protein L0Z73_12320 [Gammaproteobacteria bacterium]|nr:hypothetical protein [Gammaproteobacteria bacterium]
MKHYFALLFLIALVIALFGCELDTPDENAEVTASIINSFEVSGNTVNENEQIVLPLQPNNVEVSGIFNLLWDVTSSDPYTIEVYFSSNVIQDPIDTLFLQMQCGSDRSQFICGQIGEIPCVVAYEPVYEMVAVLDENGDPVLDENGLPVEERVVDAKGYFVVLEDHYYLRCADGPATVRIAEITDSVQSTGFPFVSYFIFRACAADELICPEMSVAVQFLDSQP